MADDTTHLELTVDKFIFRFPRDLHYGEDGLWIRQEGSLVRLGLSDFAQQRNGDTAFANLVPAGTALNVGDEVASIETVKVDLSLPSPVKGIIQEVNTAVQESPELINQDPLASIVVTALCDARPGGFGTARHLNESGMDAVTTVAEEITRHVDRLLAGNWDRSAGKAAGSSSVIEEPPAPATCSCGSGIPVTVLEIADRSVEVLALPLIFDMFDKSGKPPGTGTSLELMETVRLYNSIPENEQATWKEVIEREYAAYFVKEAT